MREVAPLALEGFRALACRSFEPSSSSWKVARGFYMQDSPRRARLNKRIEAFARARKWEKYHTPKNLAMAMVKEAIAKRQLIIKRSGTACFVATT